MYGATVQGPLRVFAALRPNVHAHVGLAVGRKEANERRIPLVVEGRVSRDEFSFEAIEIPGSHAVTVQDPDRINGRLEAFFDSI